MKLYIITALFFLIVLSNTTGNAQVADCFPEDRELIERVDRYIKEILADTAKLHDFIDQILANKQYAAIVAPMFEKTAMTDSDWAALHKIVCEMLLNNNSLSEVVIDKSKINTALKFLIDSDEYKDGDTYATMYTGKTIQIQAEKVDTASKVDITKLRWKLNGADVAAKKGSANILELAINKKTLLKESNDLVVLDSAGNKLSKLEFKTYYAPIVKFDEGKNFNGEYFFDHGYEYTSLTGSANTSGIKYETITVGKNATTYYAPVLGLLKGQTADIRIDVNDFTKTAKSDKNFKIVLKPRFFGKIRINNLDSLVLDALALSNIITISISALDVIDGVSLTPMFIDVMVQSTREKVGLLEYYCATTKVKKVILIYTKFKDESNFPTYLSPSTLQSYMNSNCMNQWFLEFQIDTVHLEFRNRTITQFAGYKTNLIIDSLKIKKFGTKHTVPNYDVNTDYFFITSLEIPSAGTDVWKGGFHYTDQNGGVQVKYRKTTYGETAEELTAHEFGHWLAMPHTWEPGGTLSFAIIGSAPPTAGGLTKDNFMDYNVRRKKWLKIQLLSYRRFK